MIAEEAAVSPLALAEEGLVLADRLALVVVDRPAAPYPARADNRTAFHQWPGLGLDLLLNLAAKAVGVGKTELELETLRRQRGSRVSLTGERCGAGGLPLRRVVRVCPPRAVEAVQVIDDARGRALQQRGGVRVRVGRSEEGIELRLRGIGHEAGERVALGGRGQRLAHDGGTDHHAQHIEGDFGLIPVRVADKARLQDAVVVRVHRDAVGERIAGRDYQQVVGVEVDQGVLAKGVAVAARQEELLPRLRQLGGGIVGRIRAVEGLP